MDKGGRWVWTYNLDSEMDSSLDKAIFLRDVIECWIADIAVLWIQSCNSLERGIFKKKFWRSTGTVNYSFCFKLCFYYRALCASRDSLALRERERVGEIFAEPHPSVCPKAWEGRLPGSPHTHFLKLWRSKALDILRRQYRWFMILPPFFKMVY